MHKQSIHQHAQQDMSAEQKRLYARLAGARNEYHGLCYREPPLAGRRKKDRRPALALAAGVAALAAVLLINPFTARIGAPEAASIGDAPPKSRPARGGIIARMQPAPGSLFADRPRLPAGHRPSFRAPARPLKDPA